MRSFLSLLLLIVLLTNFATIILKYSKPFRQSDYIETQRAFGWNQPSQIFRPFKYDGVLLELKVDAPIYSVHNGEVVNLCDTCEESRYGNYVTINHHGNITAKYYHLSSLKVKVGQLVKKEEEIGISGNTGLTTVNCLGLEIEKRGKNIDPTKIIKMK